VAILNISLEHRRQHHSRYIFSNRQQHPLRSALDFPQLLATMFDDEG
jgi:hypothetical protein